MPSSLQRGNAYLAFDLGASSGRAVVGTLDGERMRMEEVHRFPTPLVEKGDHLYWDLEGLWHELCAGYASALKAAPHLRSLSTCSWGVDYVPLGREGRPLRNAYCYRDPRTEGLAEHVCEQVSETALYRATGIQLLPINTLFQVVADLEQEPDLAEQTACRLLIADYFNHRFGGRAVAEATLASTTQLMQAGRCAWAADIMRRLGLDPGRWPEVVPPGTPIGEVRLSDDDFLESKVQHPTSSVEIVAGCSHDTACAMAAVPAQLDTRWAFLSCGTWSLMGSERTEPIQSDEAREAGFTNEAGAGDTVCFLRNLTGLWVLQECERAWSEAGQRFDYDTLLEEARAADAVDVPEIDLQEARFSRRGGMPDKLRAYCREAGQPVPESRGAMVRCILKNLAAVYRCTLDKLADVTGEPPEEVIHVVGGGSKNALLCQMTAEACGCQVVAGPARASALGNLLVQAKAAGDLPAGATLRDVARQSVTLRTYEPQTART